MVFPDYRKFRGENILEYLINYTQHFNLGQYIKFNTLLEKVSQMQDKKWRMQTRNLNNNESYKDYICDAVMVCNGHFFKPYEPNITGRDTFTGRAFHSHLYRVPNEFTNKTIVILGASESGLDIGIEIAKYVKTVYLGHRRKKLTQELPQNMIQIRGVVAAKHSNLIFSNGSRVKADGLVMCTGYLYDFPFLDESSSITAKKGKYVHPLYKHFINVNNPTMTIIEVTFPSFPFAVSYVQAKYFLSILQGKATLPSRKVMLKDSQLAPWTPVTKAHLMKHEVLHYYNDLAKAAGIESLSKYLRKAALIYVYDFKTNPMHFRDNEFILRDDGTVEFIRANDSALKKILIKIVAFFL